MSKTSASARLPARRRSAAGALLSLLAWLALLIAPVAAQAMTRIDPGVPGAIICSVNKAPGNESGKSVAPHCQLCTLAQQAVDLPLLVAPSAVLQQTFVQPTSRLAGAPLSRAPPRANPPRAPPLS